METENTPTVNTKIKIGEANATDYSQKFVPLDQANYRTFYDTSDQCLYLWVKSIPVTGVSLSESEFELEYGGTKEITATITPSYATNTELKWTATGGRSVPGRRKLGGYPHHHRCHPHRYSESNSCRLRHHHRQRDGWQQQKRDDEHFRNQGHPVVTNPTPNTLTYNGEAQNLVTGGSTNGGTIYYTVSGHTIDAATAEWRTDIPVRTDAGTYVVYYWVKGGDNWNDVGPASVVATIAPEEITVTAADKAKTYGEVDPELTWSITEGSLMNNDALSGISLTRASGEDTDEYVITVTQSEGANPNYDITFEPGTFVRGNEVFGTAVTDAEGSYLLTVEPGVYNIVITGDDGTYVTAILNVAGNTNVADVTAHSANVDSELIVAAGEDTPDVIVGGLDDEAAGIYGSISPEPTHVHLAMTIEALEDLRNSSEPEDAEFKIAQQAIRGKTNAFNLKFYDYSLIKDVDGSESPVTETNTVLEIIIPFDMSNKRDMAVYRYHDGAS